MQALEKAMTTTEALWASGLDFKIEKCPLRTTIKDSDNDSHIVKIKDRVALVRSDTKEPLGIVSPKYRIFQNTEAFSFIDSIINKDEAVIDNCGMIGVGEKIWIQLKLPQSFKVTDTDVIDNYFLLYNSHDGSSSIRMRFTPVRVLCKNMLRGIMSNKVDKQFQVRHTVHSEAKLEAAAQVLGLVKENTQRTQEVYNRMADSKINTDEVNDYLMKLYPPGTRSEMRSQNIRTKIYELYLNGKGNNGKTLWDLYNGTTEFISHNRIIRNLTEDVKQVQRARWEACAFGSGYELNAKAFDLAMEFLDTGKITRIFKNIDIPQKVQVPEKPVEVVQKKRARGRPRKEVIQQVIVPEIKANTFIDD